MSIDLYNLRKDLEEHKVSLRKHTDLLGHYRYLFGVDDYVKKVNSYKSGIDQLDMIIHLFDSNIIEEAFAYANIKANSDEFKRKNLSNPKLIAMVTDISSRLKDHKTTLDKFIPVVSD